MLGRETQSLLKTAAETTSAGSSLGPAGRLFDALGTSVLAVLVVCFLVVSALNAGFFNLMYSCYTLLAASVVAVGEAPYLLSIGPCASAINHEVFAEYLSPRNKAYVYGIFAAGGVLYCFFFNWNFMLLLSHAALGAFAHRCHQQQGESNSGNEDGAGRGLFAA
mmetsp:Transcript_85916/g.152173  ORF Transcript_85916/g.152173 Transcript_85916/m.152173 type:complete len:164 (-) Transcript_85916:75-566(-)